MYFREKYPDLLSQGLVGTKNLVSKLSLILAKNIKETLPSITKELREKIDAYEDELGQLGTPLPEYSSDKIQLVMNMVTDFCNAYTNSIKGKFTKTKRGSEKEPIGVEIRKMLSEIFKDYDRKRAEELLSDKLIKSCFANYSASALTGYPSFSAFQQLLHPLLKELIPKSNELVERVYILLEHTIQELIERIFMRFPELKQTISEYAFKNLIKCRNNSEELVNQMLESELSYLYTSDEDYLGVHGSILPQLGKNGR